METEMRNLEQDDIILFPITDETYGTGSLGETGYSAAKAIERAVSSSKGQRVIFYIAPDVSDTLKENDECAAKESKRGRALVIKKLESINSPNVLVVNSLDEMLDSCLEFSKVDKLAKNALRRFGKEDVKDIESCKSEMLSNMLENEEFGKVIMRLPDEKRKLILNNLDFMYFSMEHSNDIEYLNGILSLSTDKLSILLKHPETFDRLAENMANQLRARKARSEATSEKKGWDTTIEIEH